MSNRNDEQSWWEAAKDILSPLAIGAVCVLGMAGLSFLVKLVN